MTIRNDGDIRREPVTPPTLGGGDPIMSASLARNWWALALRGAAAVLFGIIALAAPVAAILSLALLFAAYLVVDGAFGIVAGVRAAARGERWGLLLAEGVFDLVLGVALVAFPAGAVVGFIIAVAAWSLLTGVLMVAASFKLTREHGRLWMLLAGIVSLLFGLALAVAPLIGAVVLAWWLGAYALAFGVLLLVLAFRLRSRLA
ncbi:HdeD family acid-resistance protein [Prosthecomicrobium sp. N25]|uniref:HdeD family acid-resistance protein n=1 Tax=Prosthecomicrobium sp. N25 TaxID=3129254 RepID=UPI0030775619